MARISLTEEQLSWLKNAQTQELSFTEQADHIGCCVDTLKRLLVRYNLAEFEGAKYVPPRDAAVIHWSRPCMICKSTQPRPKWQYICTDCKISQEKKGLL